MALTDYFGVTRVILLDADGNAVPTVGGALQVASDAALEDVVSGTTIVSTPTPLADWFNLSAYKSLLFVVTNPDPTNAVSVVLDTSEGTSPDVNPWEAALPAGKQVGFDIINTMRTRFRLSAYSGANSPNVSLNWLVRGVPR